MPGSRMNYPTGRSTILIGFLVFLICTACAGEARLPSDIPNIVEPKISTATSLPSYTPNLPRTNTPTAAASQTAMRTKIPVPTATPTPIPTYTILRGEVLVRANCRYGPGAPYLYKYGLVPGSNLDIIGRTDTGAWILVQAIGGNNPCWVKASLMAIKGDVMTVAPTYIPLPQSPYYAPPEWVLAKRNGDEVTIYWKAVPYRAGDETAEAPYLIEAWVCRSGKLVFTPVGVYPTQTILIDEPGCSEASHGRLFFVEKHGYSKWIKIPWPENQGT